MLIGCRRVTYLDFRGKNVLFSTRKIFSCPSFENLEWHLQEGYGHVLPFTVGFLQIFANTEAGCHQRVKYPQGSFPFKDMIFCNYPAGIHRIGH